jgi:hypothetical protein
VVLQSLTKITSRTFVNFVTPKAGVKHELFSTKFIGLKCQINSVTKLIMTIANNLVTPTAAAKLEFLLNKIASVVYLI